jgi:hypothetical protein
LPSRPVSSPLNQQSSRRSASSAKDQQSSKKKYIGLDGIFSTDVLEKEVVPGPMDEDDHSVKREH